MPQARRVLRELEYKDRLIVDVNSRLAWRWPCECKHPCEHKPTLAPVVSGKRGGRGWNCTPQYMVNDRRILDIVEQQRMCGPVDEIPEADIPDHARSKTRSPEVEHGEGVQIIPKTRSYENANPIIRASQMAKPDQHDRQTYKVLTNNPINSNNQQRAAETAATELTAPVGAASAAKTKINTPDTERLLYLETELRKEQAEQGDGKASLEDRDALEWG